MTGTLRIKTLSSGKSYYYINLSYKDTRTSKWKAKTISTGLEVKNNKRKAEAMIKQIMEQYAYLEKLPSGYDSPVNPDISFCDYLDIWLSGRKCEIKNSTFEVYTFRINAIKRYFNKKQYKLLDITPKVLDTYFKYCLQYGKVNQKTKELEPLSVRSVRDYRNILYSVFAQATIDGILKVNPVNDVHVHGRKNKEYGEEYYFMTEDEISELLHFMSKNYPRLLGITFMGAYYGLRRSEILGLKWSAVDFDKKTLSIKHTVVRVKTVNAEDETKTVAGKRVLNLFDTAESCLRMIEKEQLENKEFFQSAYQNHDGYVFTWEDGRAYDPNYISRTFKKAMHSFGRPEITLHNLRHSCASMLINKGWDIKKLQYWLGHTDAQTTLNIYSHFIRQRLNESENDLSQISLAAADLFA